jgi:glutamate-1-semialdehyde 2,1-aminomutase
VRTPLLVSIAFIAFVLLVIAVVLPVVFKTVATLRATAFLPLLSRRLSTWVKSYDYDEQAFFQADGAGDGFVARRRQGFERLASVLRTQYAQSIAWGDAIRESLSDLRFTDANRVPYPFARVMRERFNLCSVVTASRGPRLQTVDGDWTIDVSGAYGVNVAGFDRYKTWIEQGWQRVRDLGPVLGPLHSIVADNVAMLKAISGLDEVSFHMSGTEAVMAAVRTARFNTRRRFIVTAGGMACRLGSAASVRSTTASRSRTSIRFHSP